MSRVRMAYAVGSVLTSMERLGPSLLLEYFDLPRLDDYSAQ